MSNVNRFRLGTSGFTRFFIKAFDMKFPTRGEPSDLGARRISFPNLNRTEIVGRRRVEDFGN